MTDTIHELTQRKSVRVFTGEPIPEADVRLILESAAEAPTAGNQQLYTILRVVNEEKKLRLSELCDHQPFIAEAPLVLIFLADHRRWYDAYRAAGCTPRTPDVGDLLLAVEDACIAAQNAVTAAWSLGIGSCYIGDVMEQREALTELMRLPRYTFPAAMAVFGYPTRQQLDRPKPERFRIEDIVCTDEYHVKSYAELRDMFARRVGRQSFEEYLTAFCRRKYDSDFSREMSRSVREYLKEWGE